MAAHGRSPLGTKTLLGTAMFALGAAILLNKLAHFFADTSTELIGALPAMGMALLRAATTLPFAGHGRFAVVLGVLVSFWPLLLIAAGSGLLIQSQVAKNRCAAARG